MTAERSGLLPEIPVVQLLPGLGRQRRSGGRQDPRSIQQRGAGVVIDHAAQYAGECAAQVDEAVDQSGGQACLSDAVVFDRDQRGEHGVRAVCRRADHAQQHGDKEDVPCSDQRGAAAGGEEHHDEDHSMRPHAAHAQLEAQCHADEVDDRENQREGRGRGGSCAADTLQHGGRPGDDAVADEAVEQARAHDEEKAGGMQNAKRAFRFAAGSSGGGRRFSS